MWKNISKKEKKKIISLSDRALINDAIVWHSETYGKLGKTANTHTAHMPFEKKSLRQSAHGTRNPLKLKTAII